MNLVKKKFCVSWLNAFHRLWTLGSINLCWRRCKWTTAQNSAQNFLICSCSICGKCLSSPSGFFCKIRKWIIGKPIDSASVNIHCIWTVRGEKKKQVSVSACTVGRDLRDHSPHLVSGSSLLLSHCSKVILKFINETKRRYSIVWGLEGVTQDLVSSLKLSPKDGGTNSANKAEKWSWTWFLCFFFRRSTDVL